MNQNRTTANLSRKLPNRLRLHAPVSQEWGRVPLLTVMLLFLWRKRVYSTCKWKAPAPAKMKPETPTLKPGILRKILAPAFWLKIYLYLKPYNWGAVLTWTETTQSSTLLKKAWNLIPVKTKELDCHLTPGPKAEKNEISNYRSSAGAATIQLKKYKFLSKKPWWSAHTFAVVCSEAVVLHTVLFKILLWISSTGQNNFQTHSTGNTELSVTKPHSPQD